MSEVVVASIGPIVMLYRHKVRPRSILLIESASCKMRAQRTHYPIASTQNGGSNREAEINRKLECVLVCTCSMVPLNAKSRPSEVSIGRLVGREEKR